MTTMLERFRQRRDCPDGGFTLVEVMVAMTLSLLVAGTITGSVFSASKTGTVVRSQHDITQEATVVLNRMTRELREAKAIVSVVNANGPSYSTTYLGTGNVEVTFDVDFNGNGTIEPSAADPEELTYRFDRANHRVLLLAASYSTPIIAGGVKDMTLGFTGRGADWTTFDVVGANGNGNNLLDGGELKKVDAVQIHLVMEKDGVSQALDTSVNLRNLTSS